MPTAGKLVAGLALAITAAVAALVFVSKGIVDVPLGFRFVTGNAVVGFFAGWYALGRDPGPGYLSAAGTGVKSLVFLLIGAGAVFSGVYVLSNLENRSFRDPMDIPLLWIETSFNYVLLTFDRDVVLVLLAGGILSGILSFVAGRRWN